MSDIGGSSVSTSQDTEIVEWSELCSRHNKLRNIKFKDLPRSFSISDEVYKAVMDKNIDNLEVFKDYEGDLNEENYRNVMQTFLRVEEAHQAIGMRKYDMHDQILSVITTTIERRGREITCVCFKVEVEALVKGDLFLMPTDIVLLHDPATDTYKGGKIGKIKGNIVVVPISESEQSAVFLKKPLNISFVSRGVVNGWIEETLMQADSTSIERILESSKESLSTFTGAKISSESTPDVAIEGLSKLNEFQQVAVKGILAAECRPRPYILFGPPGTGKTHTLVEAITQIYVRDRYVKILFCANSNICVDDMIEKLDNVPSIKKSDIKKLLKGGNTKEQIESMQYARIHIATNVKSYTLKRNFKYDYVFIDEAGHANEPESLLPICSLKDDGCLVLAGDPKQLGPVVHCMQSSKRESLGQLLGKSLFERMFGLDVYKKDPATNKYDARYITKLLLCYRSDPRVMSISNKLFYDNELECLNKTPESILDIMVDRKPLQFYHCDGQETKQIDSTSWHNIKEADYCVDLIIWLCNKGVKPEQIGLISPYKLQSDLIESKLRKRSLSDHNRAKIATVDAFQGKEREVIIISTVRSAPNCGTSFINEPKRFNVALSRAKWSVIVVGHKDVLMRCSNWREFMGYAVVSLQRQVIVDLEDSQPLSKNENRVVEVSDYEEDETGKPKQLANKVLTDEEISRLLEKWKQALSTKCLL